MQYQNSNTKPTWSIRLNNWWRNKYPKHGYGHLTPRLLCKDSQLPSFVQNCATTMSCIHWLRHFNWDILPPTSSRKWFGRDTVPIAAYIGAYLVKIEHQIPTMPRLRQFLLNHPALVWALGFPVTPATTNHGFNADTALPSARHFNRVLRNLPNTWLQELLTAEVKQLQTLLPESFGQTVSLDTKHILAWVKENNPKAYIKEKRFDKTDQPTGDPDCKVGCKRRHNRLVTTPATEGQPAGKVSVSIGQFHWGYASGAVVTKVPEWGEFVLAEITQTFNHGDTTYFFPLMAQVEERLGFRPQYGALDAAYDAFYIYEFFHNPDHDGFAAVPLNQPNRKMKSFDDDGLPLCEAGLAMPVRKTYTDNTKAIISHRRAFHACPLLFPEANGETCPIEHKRWPKGGCSVQLPISIGARVRHQLDRESDSYKQVFAQRTAVERIFAQAVHWGIERPKLRNQQAITNQNTLIYLVINVRAIQRVLAKREQEAKK